MILNSIFAAFALLSLGLTVWQWLAARGFPLHKRIPATSPQPGVTLLKPLKGCDEHTESCLRSWFAQDYQGEIQILFGVSSANDAACSAVKKLLAEFPQRNAQLVICPLQLGPNAKVSKLAQLEPLAKHEVIVISDADVRVPEDLLANVVPPLTTPVTIDQDTPSPPLAERVSEGRARRQRTSGKFIEKSGAAKVGLVNCFYRLANPSTPAMQWEAIAINADFWSQVLQNASFRKLDFALGAVMAMRRQQLFDIGGFKALVNCLADDYQLGRRIAHHGQRIELCPVVVECWSGPMGWREVWKHQLRWARTIRACQPLPYFFSILNNVTFWSLAWLVVHPSLETFEFTQVFLAARIIAALFLQKWLTRSIQSLIWWWLVPVKDLLQFALWAGAFLGNRIEWSGQRYRLRRDGTLVPL